MLWSDLDININIQANLAFIIAHDERTALALRLQPHVASVIAPS